MEQEDSDWSRNREGNRKIRERDRMSGKEETGIGTWDRENGEVHGGIKRGSREVNKVCEKREEVSMGE